MSRERRPFSTAETIGSLGHHKKEITSIDDCHQ